MPTEMGDSVSGKLLYSPARAADMLSISLPHLYRLLERGEIDSMKIGKSRRIPASALTAFVARQQQNENDVA